VASSEHYAHSRANRSLPRVRPARAKRALAELCEPDGRELWAVDVATGRPHVGLCHSVQGTSEMLAMWLEVPYEQVNFRCGGINHQAFFLEFRRGAEDLYPRLREIIDREEVYGKSRYESI